MEKTTGQTLENYKIEPFTLVHDILINWWAILLGALAAAMLTYVFVGIRYVPQYTVYNLCGVFQGNNCFLFVSGKC